MRHRFKPQSNGDREAWKLYRCIILLKRVCEVRWKVCWEAESFLKKLFQKNFKKPLDKKETAWYNNKAVTKDGLPRKRDLSNRRIRTDSSVGTSEINWDFARNLKIKQYMRMNENPDFFWKSKQVIQSNKAIWTNRQSCSEKSLLLLYRSFNMIKLRVWSWLRTNAGGAPNTCKSNGERASLLILS